MKTANFFRATLTTVTCGLSVLTISATANAATLVDLELSLLVDVSGSVDNTEFALQRDGYVNTFSNPNLFNNFISQGSIGPDCCQPGLLVWVKSATRIGGLDINR